MHSLSSLCRTHVAIALGLSLVASSIASAQPLHAADDGRPTITATATLLAADAGRESALRVQRRSDSLLNGALIGAGVAVAGGLFLCTRTEPWRNCRDDVGPMLKIGAVGAGVGLVIDALIRRREPSDNAERHPVWRATPTIGKDQRRVLLSLDF